MPNKELGNPILNLYAHNSASLNYAEGCQYKICISAQRVRRWGRSLKSGLLLLTWYLPSIINYRCPLIGVVS